MLLSDSLIFARRLNEAVCAETDADFPEAQSLPAFPKSPSELDKTFENDAKNEEVEAGLVDGEQWEVVSSACEGGESASASLNANGREASQCRPPASCDWGASEEAPEEEASQKSFFPNLDFFSALKGLRPAEVSLEGSSSAESEGPSLLKPPNPTPLYFGRLGVLSQVQRDLLKRLRKAEVATDACEEREANPQTNGEEKKSETETEISNPEESNAAAEKATTKESRGVDTETATKKQTTARRSAKASLCVWEDEFHVVRP